MLTLDYTEYVIQGGDWGSMIARTQARMFPKNVKAVHVNLVAADGGSVAKAPTAIVRWLWNWPDARGYAGIKRGLRYVSTGNSYYRIQQNRPQTVAYCLEDSPVATLAWIYEKLLEWTDDYPWTDDEICTWISIYWFSKAGPGASVRIYHEAEKGTAKSGGFWDWMPVPLGVTQFPNDIVGLPSFVLPSLGNVVFESWGEDGGHFAAWERPEKLAADINIMFGKGGGAHGVVSGRNGLA
jgi:pimeloyl-ACP methyl ester carboxylesterase